MLDASFQEQESSLTLHTPALTVSSPQTDGARNQAYGDVLTPNKGFGSTSLSTTPVIKQASLSAYQSAAQQLQCNDHVSVHNNALQPQLRVDDSRFVTSALQTISAAKHTYPKPAERDHAQGALCRLSVDVKAYDTANSCQGQQKKGCLSWCHANIATGASPLMSRNNCSFRPTCCGCC